MDTTRTPTHYKSKTEARLIKSIRSATLTRVAQVAPKDSKRLVAA